MLLFSLRGSEGPLQRTIRAGIPRQAWACPMPVTQPLRTVTVPFLSSAALRHILEV